MRVGLLGGWNGLDPWEAQDLSGVIVRNQCFETLYFRANGKIEPDRRFLATELRLETISASGLPRYSLRLVDELKFCDGSTVQPEDVAKEPRSYTGSYLRPLLEKAGTSQPTREPAPAK